MNAMLRGEVAPITMNQCAHVHGYKMVQAFADIHELWDDVKYALDALFEFKGGTMREKTISIIQHFEYLQRHGRLPRRMNARRWRSCKSCNTIERNFWQSERGCGTPAPISSEFQTYRLGS